MAHLLPAAGIKSKPSDVFRFNLVHPPPGTTPAPETRKICCCLPESCLVCEEVGNCCRQERQKPECNVCLTYQSAQNGGKACRKPEALKCCLLRSNTWQEDLAAQAGQTKPCCPPRCICCCCCPTQYCHNEFSCNPCSPFCNPCPPFCQPKLPCCKKCTNQARPPVKAGDQPDQVGLVCGCDDNCHCTCKCCRLNRESKKKVSAHCKPRPHSSQPRLMCCKKYDYGFKVPGRCSQRLVCVTYCKPQEH